MGWLRLALVVHVYCSGGIKGLLVRMPACQPGNMLVGLFHPNKWAHEKLHCVLVLSPPVAMACTLVHSENLEKLLGITYFGLGKHGAKPQATSANTINVSTGWLQTRLTLPTAQLATYIATIVHNSSMVKE